MRPSGPRTRRPEGSSAAGSSSSGARSASGRSQPLDRDDAFRSIFGRTAAGHHMGQAAGAAPPGGAGGYVNPPQAYPGHSMSRAPPPPSQGIYDAFAPPLPPVAPTPFDPYAAPGPSNYAAQGQGMSHPSAGAGMRPPMRQGVGGPRDPRQAGGQYAYTGEPAGLGMGYPSTTTMPNAYPAQALPDDRAARRTSITPSVAPSLAPSIAPSGYSGSAPYPAAGPYAARSQPALNQYPAQAGYPSANGYGPPQRRRVDSGGFIPPNGAAQGGPYAERRADGLTPAQAYQEAEGYGRSAQAYAPSASPNPAATGQGMLPGVGGGLPRRPESDGFGHPVEQRLASGSSGRTARGVPPPTDGFISPPPVYAQTATDRARDSATPPQLPDLVTESQTFDFLEDLERLGLAGDPEDGRNGTAGGGGMPARDDAVSPKSHMPTSTSSGSLGSQQRHYEDEMRDRLTPVTQRQEYGGRSGHRRQYSDSSVVSTSTVQSRNLPYVDTAPYREDRLSLGGQSSPAATIAEGFAAATQRRLSGRNSSESVRSMPQGMPHTRSSFGSGDVRTGSFSSVTGNREEAALAVRAGSISRSRHHGRPQVPTMPPSAYNYPSPPGSSTNVSLKAKRPSAVRKTPAVYPAMLSAVAEVFKQMIPLGDRLKDGLTYKDSFDGREAVDLIADIIRTSDRNLALLLGRALDAQRFFHDVTYDHRLRDSSSEIYRFRERLLSPFVSGEGGPDGQMASSNGSHRPAIRPSSKGYSSGSLSMTSASLHSAQTSPAATPATSTTTLALTETSGRPRRDSETSTEDALPVGVFTLLTDCYSPTCTIDSLCYSINCPRRLEQQRRNNLKIVPGLTRKISEESLVDVKETGTLWIHTVSKDIADSVDEKEQRRQEAINELIYTERDFVRDLEYLLESWVKPLRKQDIIPAAKREDFVTQVFWNVHEILAVNQKLAERLTKRQKHEPIVSGVADILLEFVPLFEPFVTYGAHQLFGKYEFEKEKGSNPVFQRFVDETERDPSSRKLELNGYLTKPTTRLARYPLLLEAILKHTLDDHPDKEALPDVIKQVRAFLTAVNRESGKSENMFNLAQLDQQLIFRPGENIDLHLRDKNRELVYKGPLKSRGGTQNENADLLVFLFDHALLLVKPKWVNKHEQYKVYRKPIPLELLVVNSPDQEHNAARLSSSTTRSKIAPKSISSKSTKDLVPKPESKHGYSLTLVHLGRKGYTMTLWAPTFAGRRKWLEHIDAQQQKLRERSLVFETAKITEGFFGGPNKLNCAAPYDAGRRMIYGAEDGVYFSNLFDDRFKQPTMVLALHDVTQVDVLEEFQLLVVLAERSVTTYPLEALDPSDPSAALKRGKHLSSHTSFFKSGMCLGRTLLCIVKSSSLSTTIKTLEPVDLSARGKKQPTPFKRLLNNSNEPFKVFKEFYIPTESSSISFLKTKLCVATTKGFEVVDLETLDTQGLLDPSDSSLDFVSKRESVRPIAIYRVEEHFLLCYAEFAFYVNKTGWRARPKWGIQWEGFPTAFGLHYPYVLAFEPSFVEVRHVETGNLVQIITGNGIRCLFAETPPSTVNAPPPMQMYRPGMAPPPHPYGQHPQQQQQMYGYHPHQPPYMGPPRPQRVNVRSQIIFVSDEGKVQIMKIAQPPNRNSSGGGSIARR